MKLNDLFSLIIQSFNECKRCYAQSERSTYVPMFANKVQRPEKHVHQKRLKICYSQSGRSFRLEFIIKKSREISCMFLILQTFSLVPVLLVCENNRHAALPFTCFGELCIQQSIFRLSPGYLPTLLITNLLLFFSMSSSGATAETKPLNYQVQFHPE